MPGHALAQQRTGANTNREQGQYKDGDRLAATEKQFGVVRQLRGEHAAKKPEPGNAEHGIEHDTILAHEAEHARGLAENVPVELEIGRRGRCRGDFAADPITCNGDADHQDGRRRRPALAKCHQGAAGNHAEQDRQRRTHFNQAIAADQLLARERLRQDRVLDRAEYRGMQTHQEQHAEQQPDVVRMEGVGGQRHRADLEQLHVTDQAGLLVLLGQLSGTCRKQEKRKDEQGRCDVGIEAHILVTQAQVKGNQHDHRLAKSVVVESPQRLGGEKRREATGTQQAELALLGHRIHFRGMVSAV